MEYIINYEHYFYMYEYVEDADNNPIFVPSLLN